MSSSPQQPTYIIPPPSGANWKTPVLIAVLALLAISNIYLFVQLDHMRAENRAEMDKLTQAFNTSLEKVKIDSSEEVRRSTRRLEEVQSQLARSRREATLAVGQAKIDAQRRVDALQNQVANEQAAQQQAIAAVKQQADTANTQIATVSSDVGNVKTDLGKTKSQLEDTIANLKRATGELDNHESLIATNARELKALRELGERNYLEIKLSKSKQPTRFGDVLVELKKADPKHNRFTIQITANDKMVEKKDRTINEPIQFYTGNRQPDEIVINEVHKDEIVGYLSTPKVQTPRGTSATPSTGE
jgi:chromosome segregation ATPase